MEKNSNAMPSAIPNMCSMSMLRKGATQNIRHVNAYRKIIQLAQTSEIIVTSYTEGQQTVYKLV